MKKYEEVIFLEDGNIVEEEEMKVKTGWSLKKKLMIAGGAAAGLVLGAVALGFKKPKDSSDNYEFEEDSDDDLGLGEFGNDEDSENE